MTHREENIVNIAMKAAEMLKAGRIERDDLTGHMGLTEAIIGMAEQFEKMNAGVDFDAEGRDYWLEIDAFAEEQLMERYGCEQKPEKVSVLCEEFENEDAIREFRILAVSTDTDALRKLMEAKIAEDEYGMIADNGVDTHDRDHFLTEFNDGFVEYYIRDEEVLSREELERMVNSKVDSKHISEIVKGDMIYFDDCLYTATSVAYMTKTDNGREWNFEVEGEGPEKRLYASYFDGGIVTVARGVPENTLAAPHSKTLCLEEKVKEAEAEKSGACVENGCPLEWQPDL